MKYQLPDTTFTARVDGFDTGLVGTIGVQILDSLGGVSTPRTTGGIIESPSGSGSYLASLTAPVLIGEYTIFWDDGAITPSTTSGEPLNVVLSLPSWVAPAGTPYATVEELARILKVDPVAREEALLRVLVAAAYEIDTEVGNDTPYTSPPALAVEVNLERAVEHWQQMQSPFGLVGIGGVESPAFSSSNSWERHAVKLAPLKQEWGLA